MSAKLDYDALRAQTMGSGNDEAVTVNTRALIDKVLARYSGEWTTLRELLQNAADASATKVTIRFETLPSPSVPVPQSSEPSARLKHVLMHHTLRSMIVENNGLAFKDTDWNRLKKIAEGNPDETKIGAFGVGFYSVFADCEEPFVSSGKEALAFYWQKDALFTKRLALPNGQSTNTTFVLPMRSHTTPVPSLLSLCQFLASSLTFVGLEGIELFLDDTKISTLNKKIAPNIDLEIQKEVETKTREGLMKVTGVTKEAAQLDATWLKAVEWKPKLVHNMVKDAGSGSTIKGAHSSQSLRGFFSRLAPGANNNAALERAAKEEKQIQDTLEEDLMGETVATVFIHVNKATVKTSVNPNFASELERATKKPPPKWTTVSLLSTSYDEQVASASDANKASTIPKIFGTFVPENGKGRIFIGFTTNQTTGFNIHISTPSVIPTVERESIDLNNRYVRVWNVELLRVAGITARVSWHHEMELLRNKLLRSIESAERNRIAKEDIAAVLPEALFLHNTYTWSESTPSFEVGMLMEEAFWTCNQKTTIATLSTQGVLPSSKVRLTPEELGFVEGIPTLPEALAGVGIVKKMIDYGVVTEITISDIKSELEGKALNGAQLQQFLEWLGHKARISEIDGIMIRALLNVTVANDDEDGSERVIVLGDMKNFLNPSRIPPDMPIPPTTLPFKFTKKMARADLELLGLEDLQLVPWVRWLVENVGGRGDLSADQDITARPDFAGAVLPIVSKQWEGLSPSSKKTVLELLATRTIIPTKMGMRRPAEAYFPTVKLFDDLPVIAGMSSVKEKFLNALGVRKTVDIGVVFERLMESSPSKTQIPASSQKWSHVDLIKYLASVREDIPMADIDRLRKMKICPAETEVLNPTSERYLVSELFVPEQALRRLKLRTMQWPGMYRPQSAEGRFLTYLGLRAAPSYIDLIKIMSTAATNQDNGLRDQALKYFIDYHQTQGYAQFDHSSITLPYLPVQGEEKKAATPSNCFSNERAAIMGFDILRKDLRMHALKFGVKPDPPMVECVNRMIKSPPQSKRNAREVFAYFASRLSDINDQHAEFLGAAAIVPVASKSKNLVDSKSEKAEGLNAKCLLAYREISSRSSKVDHEEEDDSGIKSWELANAGQVVIVDDFITYSQFKTQLLAAPMEESLEDLYHSLGAPEVSSLLEEHQSIGMVAKDETVAEKLQQLLYERVRLFLHDHSPDSIKHNAKWVEQNLRVKCVRSITLRKSLQGYNLSHTEKRSAVMHNEKPILYITANGYDMLEVSQALVPVLLQRSKPQSVFMLEMILESSLPKLRSRGYNVARLLNQKATEAQIAEEARKQQLVEEQRQMAEREAAWKHNQAQNAAKAQKQALMPGVFPDSPERRQHEQSPGVGEELTRPKPRGFLSGIGRQFGFDKDRRQSRQIAIPDRTRGIEGPQEDAPPPYSQSERQKEITKTPQPESATAPHQLQQNLVNAIQASRPHNSTSVTDQLSVNDVKEIATYCDSKPGNDISYIGETSGVRVFLDNTVAANGMPAAKFLAENASALKLFAGIILDCADVFSLKRNSVHLFYDASGSTIAFNKDKALFFNYRYFENLHLPHAQQDNKADAIVYWSVVMAHELAHNLVSDHSAQHSYYTEALVIQYFNRIATKVVQNTKSNVPPARPVFDPLRPNQSPSDVD
ncbi:hypothetical protein P7C71_g2078, partial [Lecanoromycetidae sp. Uapishka_2]